MHENNAVTFYDMTLMHKCNKKYSASSQEWKLMFRRVFRRAVVTSKLRYTHYIRDGDSKTFEAILQQKLYGDDIQSSNLDYVGYVQKMVD